MADFCFFSVVFSDPSNVFKHCHNNGWLSLPHNKPICHVWQHAGAQKGAGDSGGMAMVCCEMCQWLASLAPLMFHCTLAMFLNTATTMVGSPSLTTSPFAILGNTQEPKGGGR